MRVGERERERERKERERRGAQVCGEDSEEVRSFPSLLCKHKQAELEALEADGDSSRAWTVERYGGMRCPFSLQ